MAPVSGVIRAYTALIVLPYAQQQGRPQGVALLFLVLLFLCSQSPMHSNLASLPGLAPLNGKLAELGEQNKR